MSIIQGIHICSIYKDCYQRSVPFDTSLITEYNIQSLDSSLLTLLHYAVMFRDISVVQLILEKNVQVDIQGILNRTPLFFSSDPDISTLLITNGANVNHTDNEGNTPLHSLIERFMNEDEDDRGETGEGKNFPLFFKNVKVLLWNGSNPGSLNLQQVSPKDLYKTIFPNEMNDGEEDEIKEMMGSVDISDNDWLSERTNDQLSDMFSSVESIDRLEGN